MPGVGTSKRARKLRLSFSAAGLMNNPLKTNETPSKLLEAEPNRESAITASQGRRDFQKQLHDFL